jgi:SAM-dependent methyltransferase
MNLILYFTLLIIELIFLIGLSVYSVSLLYSSVMGAPYVPTSKKQMLAILEKAKLKKGQLFIELGSGDGRIVREAVKRYNVQGIGVEINGLLVMLSNFLAKRSGLKDIQFKKDNIFNTDMSKADAIYMFLMPELMRKLVPSMAKNLKRTVWSFPMGLKSKDGRSDKAEKLNLSRFLLTSIAYNRLLKQQ